MLNLICNTYLYYNRVLCLYKNGYCLFILKDDSSLECTNHLKFCRGRNIMINFTNLLNTNLPVRYHMDVLKNGQVGGKCK